MTLLFGGIADDLTGGLELAAMLTAGGITCAFATNPAALTVGEEIEAAVIALRTRVTSPEEAVDGFKGASARLNALGAARVFFKYCATFDSTDEGNIGPCADALLAATGARQTIFCPAFPEVGRRVFQGHLFADDQLISESPKRFDPLTPMTDPNLVRVLQRQTRTAVGLLPQQTVRAGLGAMRSRVEELASDGRAYLIADAATPEDLAALAELTADWRLVTGNSSLAAYYPALWRARGLTGPPRPSTLHGVAGPGVVLAGSCAERTLTQLDVFARSRPVRTIDISTEDPADAVVNALNWAKSRLGEGPVAIATSAAPEVVAHAQARWGRREAAKRAEDALGAIAEGLADMGVKRFLVAGGETSGSVLARLGVRRLRVGAYKAPGLAQAVADHGVPMAFCLKAGKLGPEDMFLPMLESLARGDG